MRPGRRLNNTPVSQAVDVCYRQRASAAEATKDLITHSTLRWEQEEGDYRDDITAIVVFLPFFSRSHSQREVELLPAYVTWEYRWHLIEMRSSLFSDVVGAWLRQLCDLLEMRGRCTRGVLETAPWHV